MNEVEKPPIVKVTKYGGSVILNASSFRDMRRIEGVGVTHEKTKSIIVLSAPGANDGPKVTDLLIHIAEAQTKRQEWETTWDQIAQRYLDIAADLDIESFARSMLEKVKEEISASVDMAFIASRGEYMICLLFAQFLKKHLKKTLFVDAMEVVRLNNGQYNIEEMKKLTAKFFRGSGPFIVPGFYGSNDAGELELGTRDSSDASAAALAAAMGAPAAYFYKDVDGIYTADPKKVPKAKLLSMLSYDEHAEMSNYGAKTLQGQAAQILQNANIKAVIRATHPTKNTAKYRNGTSIVPDALSENGPVLAICSHKEILCLTVRKNGMNDQFGYGERLLGIVAHHNVPYEHTPTAVNEIDIVITNQDVFNGQLKGKEKLIVEDIRTQLNSEVFVHRSYASITLVGRLWSDSKMHVRIFNTLYKEDIEVKSMTQALSRSSLTLIVEKAGVEKAILALHTEFIG